MLPLQHRYFLLSLLYVLLLPESTRESTDGVVTLGSSMLSVLVNQMQILGGLLEDIEWDGVFPAWIVAFLKFVATVARLDFSALLSSPECETDFDQRSSWALGLFIPFIVMFVFVVWAFFSHFWLYNKREAYENTQQIILQSAVYVLLIGLYSSILKESTAIFHCKSIFTYFSEREFVLVLDGQPCPLGNPDEIGLLLLGGMALCLFSILPYVVIALKLRAVRFRPGNKNKADPFSEHLQKHPTFKILYGWAIKPFRKETYLWECVNAATKVIMVLSVMLFNERSSNYIFQLSIVTIMVILHAKLRPYKDHAGNHVVIAFGISDIFVVLSNLFPSGNIGNVLFQVR